MTTRVAVVIGAIIIAGTIAFIFRLGQQRSNREAKKPKKKRIKVIAAAPSQKGMAADLR